MTLSEIQAAVSDGKTVYWKNKGYTVKKTPAGEYLIRCAFNGHCTGLDYVGKVGGAESEDFFTE